MQIITGDLYTDESLEKYDFVGFTANSTLTKEGRLVMGAGSAKHVRDKFPDIDLRLGELVKDSPKYLIKKDTETNIFALQTKINWRVKSPLDLVIKSIRALKLHAIKQPDKTFAIPMPAFGFGGLDGNEIILNCLEELPDNVYVYKLK